MSKVTVLENEFASLWYHADEKIIHHKFHRILYGDRFREILTMGAELIEKHGACKYLSEDTNNIVVTKEDSEWGLIVWSSRAIKAGWKYWAIVQPEKIIGLMNVDKFAAEYAKKGVEVKMFTDYKAALAWLKDT